MITLCSKFSVIKYKTVLCSKTVLKEKLYSYFANDNRHNVFFYKRLIPVKKIQHSGVTNGGGQFFSAMELTGLLD